MKSVELREGRAKLICEARHILDKAEAEARDLHDQERAEWDRLMKEGDTLGKEIEKQERMEYQAKVEEDLQKSVRQVAPYKPADMHRYDRVAKRAVRNWMRGGLHEVSHEERDAAAGCGIDLGSKYLRFTNNRAEPGDDGMGVGVSAKGDDLTVTPVFFQQLTEALKAYGSVLSVADVIPSQTGSQLIFPTANDTSNTGEIISELSAVNFQAIATDQTAISTYLYSSKAVPVSYQLLQDAFFDVGAFIAKSLGTRIGRILNTHLTTGDGNSKPYGVVTGASSGVSHSPATGAISYTDLVDMQDALEPAYDGNATWMMSRKTWGAVRKIVDGSSRPVIWSAADALSTEGFGTPTILGDPVVFNVDLTDIASSAKCIVYGDFSNYKVVQVQDVVVQRLEEIYALNHAVAFLAFARFGGRLIDAGTHPLIYFKA